MVANVSISASQRPIQWAVDAGHEVLVVAPDKILQEAPPNYQAHPFRFPNTHRPAEEKKRGLIPWARAWTQTWAGPAWWRMKRLQRIAAQFQPDVIHAHFINQHTYDCARAGLSPLIISIWGALNHLMLDSKVSLSPQTENLFDQTSGLIVESPYMAQLTESVLPEIPCHINIPMGIDSDLFHPRYSTHRDAWRYLWQLPDDALVFFSARGIGHSYGHESIVEAFAQARSKLSRPAYLVIGTMGRGGDYKANIASIEEMIDRCGVRPYVRWAAKQNFVSMPQLYGAVDVVVSYPSTDAFPSTLIEAAACGKYIIGSDSPTYQGTFLESCSTLVPIDNVPKLGAAMVTVGNAPVVWRQTRIEQAQTIVAAEYTTEVVTERLLSTYERVASLGRGL